MSAKPERKSAPIVLKLEADFELGLMTVRPSACEIVVDGEAHRVEARVMQTLVALAHAMGEVVSRGGLIARCWDGAVVSDDAVTRAVGQVRRFSRQVPGSFALQTIAKVGYRLTPAAGLPARGTVRRALETRPRPSVTRPVGLLGVMGVVVVAAIFVLRPTVERSATFVEPSAELGALGTAEPDAHDREPRRAGEAHAELDELLESETVDTPLAWRGHVMRGFQHVFAGDWLAAERSLASARNGAPPEAHGTIAALQTALHGSVGRIADSLELVLGQAQRSPLSRDQSRVVQQWLDRSGRHDEAEAEYARSRDLPGDRSAMELAAVVRALGHADAEVIKERYERYRETDWGRSGDDELFAALDTRAAALDVARRQIRDWRTPGAMPPFLAAAWASYLGDQDLAIEGLRASPESVFSTGGLLWEPVFATTRRTSAFKMLVRDFGYVEYWRATGAWGDFCRPVGATDFECS